VHESLTPSVTPDVMTATSLAMPCIAENSTGSRDQYHHHDDDDDDSLFIYLA
jgi:hypothetical protein